MEEKKAEQNTNTKISTKEQEGHTCTQEDTYTPLMHRLKEFEAQPSISP